MNYTAVKYCGRRSAELTGTSSVNARYQVKEAFELAIVMQRAYLATFVAKNVFNGVVIASCFEIDEDHKCILLLIPVPYNWMETIYALGVSTSSIFLLCSLLHNHPRLKLKAALFLSKFRMSNKVHDAFQPPRFET
ncbi:hypothetical protein PMAYCL1PPCAC_16925, partial [Pristionchus mayeri]